MSSLIRINPNAQYMNQADAVRMNTMAATGLMDVMKTSLGPNGTMKLLVSGSGGLKLTKDGNVLLHEMQITNPTSSLIAKVSTAQNDVTGDGTTSVVLLIGELMRQAEIRVNEGVHPRILSKGFDIARALCLKVLDDMKITVDISKELLLDVARASIRTKLMPQIADHIAGIVTDAVMLIRSNDKPLDLHMIEVMSMQQGSIMDTALVKGLVLDHGTRHPKMQKHVRNAHILILNVSLEYEKTELKADMVYTSFEQRRKYLEGERAFIDDRAKKIIELKRQVCGPNDSFVVINQKGIDPPCLEMLASEGIMALRRAKRRNMERLMLACGGQPVNSVEDLSVDVLGYAGLVYEHVLDEEKFTFVEECRDPKSVTILIKGPYEHNIVQIKDAVYDGLRAVKNVIDDGCVVPGAGAFELSAYCELNKAKVGMESRSKLGVHAFADALLVVVKCLAENAGFEPAEITQNLVDKRLTLGRQLGLDIETGGFLHPEQVALYDNYCVKRNMINSSAIIASNLLLVDEILRCGVSTKKQQMQPPMGAD